jgi:hypothetical protein
MSGGISTALAPPLAASTSLSEGVLCGAQELEPRRGAFVNVAVMVVIIMIMQHRNAGSSVLDDGAASDQRAQTPFRRKQRHGYSRSSGWWIVWMFVSGDDW